MQKGLAQMTAGSLHTLTERSDYSNCMPAFES